VTVLFADLVNSTALGERLDPEALRIIQTRFFDTMRATIERHEGSVEKFIGDEVMSVFGLPRLHEDDALRAVRAAADMQQALDALNRDLDTRRGVRLAIRTGINSGTVVAGDANSGRALVTGDVVVTAKRLETAAQPGEILIGAETYRLVGHAVDSEPLPPITAKGKAEPLRAWRVAAVDPAAGAIPRHLHSPFVGRDRQLRVLIDVAERSRAERTVLVVSLLGPAGVGKTRLAQEFTTRLGTGASVIRGHCLPYGEGISYWPLAEALRTAAGITPDEDPETARGHLAALAIDLPRADVVIDRISAAIGVAPTTGSSGIDAQETYWAFRRLLEGMARQRPLLAIFDDVQWATPTFLDLLEHLGDWSREAPILLLVIARSELLEVRPSWGAGKPSAAVLFLEPLDEAAVSEMLSNLTGHQLPESLAREIEQTAEGNPFFVEELVANLLDDGGLASRSDGYRLTSRPHRVAIPPTIELLLASRLDALPDRERTLLGSAAVVGRRFGAAEVAELSDPADRRLILPALMAQGPASARRGGNGRRRRGRLGRSLPIPSPAGARCRLRGARQAGAGPAPRGARQLDGKHPGGPLRGPARHGRLPPRTGGHLSAGDCGRG
jgi:class 3 adenylate cyclase